MPSVLWASFAPRPSRPRPRGKLPLLPSVLIRQFLGIYKSRGTFTDSTTRLPEEICRAGPLKGGPLKAERSRVGPLKEGPLKVEPSRADRYKSTIRLGQARCGDGAITRSVARATASNH